MIWSVYISEWFLSSNFVKFWKKKNKTKSLYKEISAVLMGEIMLIMDLNKTYVKDKQYLQYKFHSKKSPPVFNKIASSQTSGRTQM
jgi:hypothetical protein